MTNKFIYAGFWLRFLAVLVDGILLSIVGSILNAILPDLANLTSTVIGAAYFIYFESSEYQGTPGKMLLGLKVTDLKGGRITPVAAVIRYVAKILSAIILLIGYIMAAFTEKKQALHDIIASTLVIKNAATEKADDNVVAHEAKPIEVTPADAVVE